jgi:peptide/nickel transport system substrate-binding protein
MQYIRTQAILALIGLAIVGGVLYSQAQRLSTIVVPAEGGTFNEAIVGLPGQLNPLFDRGNPVDRDLDRLIFSGLMKFDANGLPVTDLAESYAVSADGLTYTFVLRDGLRWHDGAPLTHEDVAFTISLMQDPTFPGPADVAGLWRKVSLSSPARNTIRFVLPEPFAPFLDYTTVGLLPKHLLEGISASQLLGHPFNSNPIGAGPMRLVRLDRQNGLATDAWLEPNLEYSGAKKPLLAQLHFHFYPTAEAAYEAYTAGEVQALSAFTPDTFSQAVQNPNLEMFSSRLPEYTLIFLNQKNEGVNFFQEKKVRQALLAGLNRQTMVDTVLRGQAFVATGPILPGTWAYNDNLTPIAYDPVHAADLLNSAGWALPPEAVPGAPDYVRSKNGRQLKFSLLVPPDGIHQAVALLAIKDWAVVGVQATMEVLPANDIKSALGNRTFQAAMVDLNFSATPDPDPYPFWHQTQIESGQNFSGFNSRDISEILEQARINPSYKDRVKFYRAFQNKFMDQVPALLLYYPIFNYAVDKKVGGVQLGPLVDRSDRFNSMADWYIVTRRVIENAPEP